MTMKRGLRLLLLGFLFAGTGRAQDPVPSSPPEPESAPSLRARLLEFGGALANDGFRLRDGYWSGRLEPGRPRRLAVNLFAGNQYWFCAAVDAPGDRPSIVLYDPRGEAVRVLAHEGPGLSAAGVTAPATGRYVVQIETSRGPAADFCLLYLFK